MMGLMGYKYEF